MIRLIKFEFHKLIRKKNFYICFGISAVIMLLNLLLTKAPMGEEDAEVQLSAVSFAMSTLSNSSFLMLAGIFTALYVCDDYANNTLKNIYSHGYSRAEVYFSKYVVSLLAELAVAVLLIAVAFLLGQACANVKSTGGAFIGNLLCQLFMLAAYHGIYFSLAYVIGKTGGSVAINIVGPSLVLTVLSLITSLLKIDITLSDYWLDSVFSSLAQGLTDAKTIVKAIVMPLIYGGVFVTAGYLLSRKKEF